MNRREALTALAGSGLAAASAEVLAAPIPAAPATPEPPPVIDPAIIERVLKERVFFVAAAAALPQQRDDQVPPLVIAPMFDQQRLWLELLPQPSGQPDLPSHFSLRADLEVGTIDELVAHYRQRLTAACAALVEFGFQVQAKRPDLPAYDDSEKTRVAAAKLGYKPGQAISAPLLSPLSDLAIESTRAMLARWPSAGQPS